MEAAIVKSLKEAHLIGNWKFSFILLVKSNHTTASGVENPLASGTRTISSVSCLVLTYNFLMEEMVVKTL